jgi:hypothetical protein
MTDSTNVPTTAPAASLYSPVKPGLQTTEFWLALIVAVGGMLATAYSPQPWAQVAGIISAALASMGYGFVRAQVKAAP